jgi:5-methyltetrahydrofolate--homocysteine methyltransferase
MTGAERVLWESLRDRRLDGLKFRRQYAVGPYVLDFCCPSLRLAVEVDGAVHDATEQVIRDGLRTEHLALFDYLVLRVRNEDVFTNLGAVLDRISAVAASRQIGAQENT